MKPLAIRVILLLALAAASLPIACRADREAPRAGGDTPVNVLVVCIDVLRADHLGGYGYPAPTSPWIDRLTRAGVVFENCVSAASWTKPSVPSYFTGRFPHQHGLYEGSRQVGAKVVSDVLPADETTLAEMYRAAGFRTAAFVHNAQINAEFGFDQGFERYEDDAGDAVDIADRFLAWVEGLEGQPFFSYLHFLDVHWPYDPPGPFRDVFEPPATDIDFATPAWRVLKRRIRDGAIRLSGSDREAMVDLYDGELRFTDDQIGRIVEALRGRGLLDRTLVVLLADHGEEFLEHGKIGHGNSLYDELLRVPLLMRFPDGRHGGARVATPVSLVDVLPTLAAFSGIDPPAAVSGRSLLPILRGEAAADRPMLYSEGIHGSLYQQCLRTGPWKYIATVEIDRVDPDDEEDELRDSIDAGLRVEVEGVWVGEGDFLAEEIEIQDDQEDERDKVTGPVEAIDTGAGWMQVLGYRVPLVQRLDLEDAEGEHVEPAVFTVDTMVKMYGKAISATEFRAEKIILRAEDRRRKIKLEGAVAGPVQRGEKELRFRLAERRVRADSHADVTRQIVDRADADSVAVEDPGFADPWESALASGTELREELYHLGSDPAERSDLAGARPEEVKRLRDALRTMRAASPARRNEGKALSEDELEALRKLGYVK